jgi:hypothetical protein
MSIKEWEKKFDTAFEGGRTPKYKMLKETALRAYSCTGPTADQQYKLKWEERIIVSHVIDKNSRR